MTDSEIIDDTEARVIGRAVARKLSGNPMFGNMINCNKKDQLALLALTGIPEAKLSTHREYRINHNKFLSLVAEARAKVASK